MSSIKKIGLFDSGLGGLTVLRALNKMLPNAATVYFGDTLHLPYGDKSDEAIIGYSTAIVQFLKDQGCGLIVIACNSASAAAGKALEEKFPELNFVNVIDPVINHLAALPAQKVGLFGTRATVRSGAYSKKLAAITRDVQLAPLATPLLVPLIEDGFLGTGIETSVLEHYLNDASMADITALVPGCTHYPLLEDAATSILSGVHWVDAPSVVAEAVSNQGSFETGSSNSFYLSDRTDNFLRLAKSTFGIDAQWEVVRLED